VPGNSMAISIAVGISVTLAKTLWGSVAVGDTTSPVTGDSMTIAISIGISVSVTLSIGALW